MSKQVLALFDLDGTITYKDTYLEIVRYDQGSIKASFAYMYLLWLVFLLRRQVISNDQLKTRMVKKFFKGRTRKSLVALGQGFAQEVMPNIVYKDAMARIQWHKSKKHRIVIVTASCDFWLESWAKTMGFDLVCTQVKFENDRFNGELKSANCYAKEKINRLKMSFPFSDFIYGFGYGDTPSDRYFMALADQQFMNHFSMR